MIVTKDEAKTKFCPHMRISGLDDAKRMFIPAHNIIVSDGYSTAKCLASDCMMWVETESRAQPKGLSKGYCGLRKEK